MILLNLSGKLCENIVYVDNPSIKIAIYDDDDEAIKKEEKGQKNITSTFWKKCVIN